MTESAHDAELVELEGDRDLVADISKRLAELYSTWSAPPAELVGQKAAGGGFQADYLGHAETTRALLEADPLWTLEPARYDPETGGPTITHKGDRLVSWWRLQVCGHERLCVGTCRDDAREPEKELIGDAIRNGAMRFGVALALWSRSEAAAWQETTPPSADQVRASELRAELQRRAAGLEPDALEVFRTALAGAQLPAKAADMTLEQLNQARELLDELDQEDPDQ